MSKRAVGGVDDWIISHITCISAYPAHNSMSLCSLSRGHISHLWKSRTMQVVELTAASKNSSDFFEYGRVRGADWQDMDKRRFGRAVTLCIWSLKYPLEFAFPTFLYTDDSDSVLCLHFGKRRWALWSRN
ncbi:hypothetical protein Ancab_032265 [Ancistrocladus abbreviatus]